MKTCEAGRRASGLTGLEAMVLVVVGFAVITFLLPFFARPRCTCMRTNCMSNLRQIGTAFRLWGDDNDSYYPMHFVGNPNYPQLTPATSWLGQTQDYADAYVYF